MTDYVTVKQGSGSNAKNIAADDVSGVMYQRVKIAHGVDGSATDVSTINPLPVTIDADIIFDTTGLAQDATIDEVSTVLGIKTDAKSTATDGTSISAVSIWKQISASVQAIVTALAGTLTVATHAVTQSGTWNVGAVSTVTNVVHVDDNSSSLTVDGTVATTPVTVSTGTVTALASSLASAQLLAANSSRKGLFIVNTDVNAALIKFGTTASVTSFNIRLVQFAQYEMGQPVYTGRIDALWEGDGSGSLYVTEL